MITFKDWYIRNDGQDIGFQYDNLTRMVLVTGDLPLNWDWDLLVSVEQDGYLDCVHLTPMEAGAGALLTGEQLAVCGHVTLQLRGSKGEMIRHTNKIDGYIGNSISGDRKWPSIPTEFSQLEKRCRELRTAVETSADQAVSAAGEAVRAAEGIRDISEQVRQVEVSKQAAETARTGAEEAQKGAKSAQRRAEEALTKAPRIVAGSWQIWDAVKGVYLTTGVKAQGPAGEAGPRGAAGPAGRDGADGEKGEPGKDAPRAQAASVILTSSGWSGKAQTVSHVALKAAGFSYIYGPAGASMTAWAESKIYADDITVDGRMTFHCETVPKSNITVNVTGVSV